MERVDSSGKGNRNILASRAVHWIVAFVLMLIASLIALLLDLDTLGAVLFVATGALAGFFTNDIAVTMLFWPTERRFKGVLLGFFYKRREEFGHALINQAHQKFLNPDFFRNLVEAQPVKDALYVSVEEAVDDIANSEIGNVDKFITKIIPDEDQKDELLNRIAAFSGNEIAQLLFRYGTTSRILGALVGIRDYIGSSPLSSYSPNPSELTSILDQVAKRFFRGPSRDILVNTLTRLSDQALASEKSLNELIPEETQARLERIAQDYTSDVLIKEISKLCADPIIRARVVTAVDSEIRTFVFSSIEEIEGLKGFIIKTFGAKEIDGALNKVPPVVDDFILKLPQILSSTEVNKYFREATGRTFKNILRIKLCQIRNWLPKDIIKQLLESVSYALGSETVIKQIAEGLSGWLERNHDKKVREVLPILFDSGNENDDLLRYLSSSVAERLKDSNTRSEISLQSRIIMRRLMVGFLDMHLDRLVDVPFIKNRGLKLLTKKAAEITVRKLQEIGPTLVEKFPVREQLSGLWESMTNKQIQESVHGVLAKEFKILINLGISLGATVGFITFVLQSLGGTIAAAFLLLLMVIIYGVFKARIVLNNL